MERPASLPCVLAAALSLTAPVRAAAPAELFVAVDGADQNVGSREKPFATLTRARDAIRQLRARDGLPPGGVTVWVGGGAYRMSKPLELTKDDRGAPDSPVVYRAQTRGAAVVTGGVVLAGWRPVSDPAILALIADRAKGEVYEAAISKDVLDELPGFANGGCGYTGEPEHPLALFQAGARLPVARWPNAGYAKTGECLGPSRAARSRRAFTDGVFRFEHARLARWAAEPDLWFDGLWFFSWADQRMRLKAIDLEARTISLRDPRSHRFGFRAGQGFFALNAIGEIDRPGEWAVDRAARRVYLWPRADPAAAPVTVAVAGGLVRASGAAHTTFQGLVFEACRERAIVLEDCTAVTLGACTLRHLGSTCVDIRGGSKCKVVGCDLYDLGEGGVWAAGGDQDTLTPGGHVIENNHIHHFGRVVHTYRYGAAVYGVGNVIRHNLVHHAQHTALFFRGNDHLLEYNVVHDVCLHSTDAGVLHPCARDWTLRGVVIRHNFFHATGKGLDPCGCHGIYLDDYTSGATIVGNICSMVGHSVTTCGNGNRVENNLSVNSRKSAFVLSSRGVDSFARANAAKGRQSHLVRKLLAKGKPYGSDRWRRRYPALPALLEMIATDPVGAHDSHFCTMRNNVNVSGEPVHVRNAKKVVRTGTFENNVDFDRDPGFVDYAHFDLRLRPDSPVFRKLPGFKPLEFEKMGLYDDPMRASPAVKFGADITPMAPIMSPEERERADRPLLRPTPRASAPITVDGDLGQDEWPRAARPWAVLQWARDLSKAPETTRVWTATDDDHLYLAFHNPLGPGRDATTGRRWGTDDGVEVSLAPVVDANIPVDLTVTILRGYANGRFECATDGGLDDGQARAIAACTAFAARRMSGAWSCEWRIPFAALGMDPKTDNWPILAHLSAHQAAAKRTVCGRRRRVHNTWDVSTGAYALCLDAFGSVPFAPGSPLSEIRIDVQGDRKAASPTLAPGPGATTPEWARKWNRIVATFGTARADRWKACRFEFTPLADAVVAVELLGVHTPGSPIITWTYYDDFRVDGAELVNGGFEDVDPNGKCAGWNCVLDRNWKATPSSKAGVVENRSLAASGTRMARSSCDHRVVQRIKVTRGRKVTVRFQARGVLPGM